MNKSKRLLVGKAERNKRQPNLSHDEVAAAIRKFQERGGLIKHLPPERAHSRRFVGRHLESPYESVIDH